MTHSPTLGPTPDQTARRGDRLDVVLCAYEAEPRTERIFVRQLPIARVEDETFQNACAQGETAMIQLYTGMDREWVEELTEESHVAILALGRQLNFPTLQRWIERKSDLVTTLLTMLATCEKLMTAATAPLANVLSKLQQSFKGSRTKSTPSSSPSRPLSSGSAPDAGSTTSGSTPTP